MTKEEFQQKVEQDPEWAPGWEAIEGEFGRLYPGQEPKHYGTNLVSRASFGGDQYLDGYSIYTSSKGYQHIVTFGMTELYAQGVCLGAEWNKWGYEMTIKLAETCPEDCLWAIDMLSNLARYTFTKKRFFEPFQFIAGNGSSLRQGVASEITALMTIADTEARAQTSVYGKTEFIQLVGITERELQAVRREPEQIQLLYQRMREENPDLVTDMGRTVSYL